MLSGCFVFAGILGIRLLKDFFSNFISFSFKWNPDPPLTVIYVPMLEKFITSHFCEFFFLINLFTPFFCLKVKSLSHVQLFATPWIVAYQASPSMGFSRQEYWSGLPFPSPEDLPRGQSRVSHIVGRCFYCLKWVAQSCPTLCNLMDYSPPVPSVHRILPARILAIPFSRGSFWSRDQTQVPLHCRQILYCLSYQGSHTLSLRITTESNAKLNCTSNFSAGRLGSNVWALPWMVHPAAFESNTWKEVSRVCYMGCFARLTWLSRK